MKVEKATIKLVLRTNKVLSNGNHPIMIRVNWGGKRAEKSTGYSCKKAHWNEKTGLLKEGKGKLTFDDGAYYEGDFENNIFNGKGKYVWENKKHRNAAS